MKKIFTLFLSCACVLLLGSCSANESKNYTVSLDENGGTGYTWTYTMSEPGIVEEVANGSESVNPEAAGGLVHYTWEFKALQAGTTVLTYTDAAVYDETQIASIVTLTLTVDEKLNITATTETQEFPFVDESNEENYGFLAIDGSVLSFQGNATTGYEWMGSVEESESSIVALSEPEYTMDNETVMGAGGITRFTVTGLQEGIATLTFTYSRPWESVQPLKTETFQVVVDADLNCTIDQLMN